MAKLTAVILERKDWKKTFIGKFQIFLQTIENKQKKNSVACSPQANYTDRATAACRWSECQLLRIGGVAWSAQLIPTDVNLSFLDRSRYFLEISRQLFSCGRVDPVPDPLILRKTGSDGNRPTHDNTVYKKQRHTLIPRAEFEAVTIIFVVSKTRTP
jgi:hypothetical protein